jgi:hypothetical protein
MKPSSLAPALLLGLAFALSLTAAAPRAEACGDYTLAKVTTRERATGQWPSLERRDGVLKLALSYPRFARSTDFPYLDWFTVVADRNLRRLERALAEQGSWNLRVTIEEVSPGRWRVVSWRADQ